MHKKFDRVWAQFQNKDVVLPVPFSTNDMDKLLDDAYDLLNYTGFFIQQVEDNNPDGQWDWQNE